MHSIACVMSYASCHHAHELVCRLVDSAASFVAFCCYFFLLALSFGIRFLSIIFCSFVDHQIVILCTKHTLRFIKMKQFTSYEIMFHVINGEREQKKSQRLKAKKKKQPNNKTRNWFSALILFFPSSGRSLAAFFILLTCDFFSVFYCFWLFYRSHWEAFCIRIQNRIVRNESN